MLTTLDRSGARDVPVLTYFVPGMLYGALFEVIALVPLLLLLRRYGKVSVLYLSVGGVLLWTIAATLNIAATSQLSLLESIGALPMLMIPGVVLVLVFALVISNAQAA